MELKKVEYTVQTILKGSEYLGEGASKEAYVKNGIVYKVPRGRYIITQNVDSYIGLKYPTKMSEVDDFLMVVADTDEAMVWPLGQFAIELIVWNAIQQLRSEGLEINCFAEIKDYYMTADGVIVIEQELANGADVEYYHNEEAEEQMSDLITELNLLKPILAERFDIKLRDIREGNCGQVDGRMKLFDFGISTSTQLDSYGSYSSYTEDSYSEENSWE